jgi:hypothetical protein
MVYVQQQRGVYSCELLIDEKMGQFEEDSESAVDPFFMISSASVRSKK